MGVLVQLAEEREVLSVAVVVIARDDRRLTVGDAARLLLPFPPVGVAVFTLDLVRSAGGSPQKTLGKGPGH